MSRRRRQRQERPVGLNKHHVTPRSRDGGGHNNITWLPVDFHAALHCVASNLTKEETLRFLDIVLTPNTTWTHSELHELREALKR